MLIFRTINENDTPLIVCEKVESTILAPVMRLVGELGKYIKIIELISINQQNDNKINDLFIRHLKLIKFKKISINHVFQKEV